MACDRMDATAARIRKGLRMNKLKLCPFCGSEVNTAYRSGGVCVVSCTCCKADGPVAMVEDYLNFSDEVITDDEWNLAVDYAKSEAVKKWNMRPPMTNLTAEELADFEKTRSAALYGANCRED